MAKPKFKLRPILRRAIPTIACINSAADEKLKANFDQLIYALQAFLDNCFAPVWGTPAKLLKSKSGINNAWTLLFLDDADAVTKENGLHQMTLNGCPLAKVFVKSTLSSHEKVSVAACHELAEMLVDPGVNMWADGPKGTLWAYEVCDAVEETTFRIERTFMSDFVYPAYFELFRTHDPEPTQFDYLKKVKQPFQLLSGGYSSIRKGKMIKEIFGSKGKKRRFEREDRRLHRSEYRRMIVKGSNKTFITFIVAAAASFPGAIFAQAPQNGNVSFVTNPPNEIVSVYTKLSFQQRLKPSGTLFLWPGLQPSPSAHIICRSTTAFCSQF